MIRSIHHYELADSTTDEQFREAVREAKRRDLFSFPGLVEYQFLHGIKGHRKDGYTALWTYESREVWRSLWGPVDDPVPKEEYPEQWREWEEELLAPLVAGDPDDIEYTTYEVLTTGRSTTETRE